MGYNRWEAADGFELTDDMRLVIAARAGLLVLGLDLDWYAKVGSIIVPPHNGRRTSEHAGLAENVVTEEPVDCSGRPTCTVRWY